MKHFNIALVILALVVIVLCGFIPGECAADELPLLIIHTNDLHGHMEPYVDESLAPPPEKVGGAAYITALIKQLKEKYPGNTLLLDGGDCAMGTPLSNEFRGIPVIEYMNMLHYQAMAVGNHEFDWGLSDLKNMSRHAAFPFLTANVIDRETGEVPSWAKPYHIFQLDGEKIGIIGLTTTKTPEMSNPKNIKTLQFIDPLSVLPQYIEELHQKGVTIIGVLSHTGIIKDREIAEKVPGISFIIGGHSHKALKDPENIRGTVIAQAGAYGMYVGALHLKIDTKTGQVLSLTRKNELIPIIDGSIGKPDREVEELLSPYSVQINRTMNAILGHTEEIISKTPPAGRGDSAIGDLITDILRQQSGAEIFFYNAGGLRNDLPAGNITRGDVYKVLPFDDYIVTMDLTGREILDILTFGTRDGQKMIQVSGLSFNYHSSEKAGKRLTSVKVGESSLKPDKTYRVGTIDYLFNGGDGYMTFKKGKNIRSGTMLVRNIVYDGIKARGTITVPSSSRIIITGKTSVD